ncbi:MAG: hypothetical protein RI964_872 [Pseudomonadota bacterium]|jgi:hypothetical protein
MRVNLRMLNAIAYSRKDLPDELQILRGEELAGINLKILMHDL